MKLYNLDCIKGCIEYIQDNSIDLIITDPPYGISGEQLDKHYNRNESHVIDGYVDVPIEEYEQFSMQWIEQADRILKPGGSIYIVSGYTNLFYILKALRHTSLQEKNHIIWKYNFGIYTSRKYISSHYHILFYTKPGGKHTFNTFCRYDKNMRSMKGNSLNYADREDVWIINREYKPNTIKNKNELPTELLTKMIQYSSNPHDVVCDLFLGGFTTAKVAIGLRRDIIGFEINKHAYDYQLDEMKKYKEGWLLDKTKITGNNLKKFFE